MFRKSILGGICIGIGALIYLKYPNPIGAAFFSAGLLLIMTLGYKLYTGVIAYVQNRQDLYNAIIILLGNLLGALIALLGSPAAAQDIVSIKLASTISSIFCRAMLCGGIIYGCVEAHKKQNDLLVILFVAAFILSGAEHSIADFCYIIVAREFTLQALYFIIIVVIGNGVGAQIFRQVSDLTI